MTTFAIPRTGDPERDMERHVTDVNTLAQYFFHGTGVPAFTPPGRAIFIRTDGGAGTTLYCYSGAAWNAFA